MDVIRRETSHLITPTMSDRELLDRFVEDRDESAFSTVVARHGAMVLGVCARVLRHRQDAEDALQATFLVLARKAGTVRKRTSLASWLHGVACHAAKNVKRSLARRSAREAAVVRLQPERDEGDPHWREVQVVLDEEIRKLPERYRIPLVLCYFEGKTRDEAAQEVGWSVGTLRGRLDCGRDLLRSRLARRGLTLSAALFAGALAKDAASAAVSPALTQTIVNAGLRGCAKNGLSGCGLSAQALSAAEGVLKTMAATKLKLAAAAILGAGLIAAGTFQIATHGRDRDPSAVATVGTTIPQIAGTPERAVTAAPGEPSTRITPILALPPQVPDPDVQDPLDVVANSKPIPPQSRALFRDEFSDLTNSRRGLSDGTRVMDSKPTRALWPFAPSQFQGRLALIVSELPEAVGADSRPGILRVEWEHVPDAIDYSGFRYEGRPDPAQRFRLPQLMTARTPEDLRGLKFRAKFKAENENRGDEATIKFDLRLEPVEDRSFDNRLDFGTIEASSTWKTFEIDLADAKNGERFVEMFARRGTGLCALIFAQAGSIDNYHEGDGLLIDDIEILDERPPGK